MNFTIARIQEMPLVVNVLKVFTTGLLAFLVAFLFLARLRIYHHFRSHSFQISTKISTPP